MYVTLLKVALFCLLVPGVVFRLYPRGTMVEQTLLHGLVFVAIMHVIYKNYFEYFGNPDTRVNPPCQKGYHANDSGDCFETPGAQISV